MNKFLSPASNRPFNRFASTIIGQQPVTSLTLSDLNANAFVKTDSSKKLVSANISSADITDLPVSKRLKTNDLGSIVAEDISISEIVNLQNTLNSKVDIEGGVSNPMISTLDVNSKKIINVDRITVDSISDYTEQRVIDFATPGTIEIYASSRTTINSDEVLLNSIKDYTSTSTIAFTTSDEISLSAPVNINLTATNINYNTIPVALPLLYDSGTTTKINTTGGSTAGNNVLIGKDAYLNGTSFNNVCIGNDAAKVSTGQGNVSVGVQSLLSSTTSQFSTALGIEAGKNCTNSLYDIFIGKSAGLSSSGISGNNIIIGAGATLPPGVLNSIVVGGVAGESGAFTYGISGIRFQNGGDNAADLGASNHRFRDLYLGRNMIVNGNTMTAVGGVWMQLTPGAEIHSTTTETSLLVSSTSLGTLVVGANTSSQSAFQLVLYGTFGAVLTHDLTIRVKMGPTTIATLFMQDLVGVSGEHFEIECDYSITDLTSPTLASITTNLEFSYSATGSASFVGDRIVNTTTFDSTVANVLSVTAQWGSANANDKIRCLRGSLRRTY
jgi:hypothetical protein